MLHCLKHFIGEQIIMPMRNDNEDINDIDDPGIDLEFVPAVDNIMMIPVKKINYLNNKDMLKEIHRSKNSFSEFIDPMYHDYDAIVSKVEDIFLPEIQEKGRISRAARMGAAAFAGAVSANTSRTEKPKLSEHKVNPDTISNDVLIYRVLTYEHIPRAPGRKKNPKSDADRHIKLNFGPFKHYIIENGEAKEVGRSHSKGGKFNLEKGSITNTLAKMFILLVNKYGQMGNWRGYCVDQGTEALTKRGWLGIDEITTNDTILSYNHNINALAWSTVKSVYRGEFNGKMHKLTQQGFNSLITPNHKIVTTRGLVPVELLKQSDKVLMLANAVEDTSEVYDDNLVELMAWLLTSSCYQFDKDDILEDITVSQQIGNYADRIRSCLQHLNYKFSEQNCKRNNITFSIDQAISKELFSILPNKNEFMNIIVNLTERQRWIFLNTIIDGGGRRTGTDRQHLRYAHDNKEHIDCVQALCAVLGKRSNTHYTERSSFSKLSKHYSMNIFSKKKNITTGAYINLNGGLRTGREYGTQLGNGKICHMNVPTTEYTGQVWCPETEYGSFVARRSNTVFLTGNTYLDEMKGQALLQLAQMGLQFDESKSDNPFSYYTMSLQNSFTRVFNLEKKNQDLRDDLLIDGGVSPSFSRQLEHETHIRQLREDAQESNKDIQR